MNSETFFEEPLEQSKVKSRIVEKYFSSWSQVILNSNRKNPIEKIGYFDLFAGTGMYNDGSKSTPLLIIEKALSTPFLVTSLMTVFNDADEANCALLQKNIMAMPGIDRLTHKPDFSSFEMAGENFKSVFCGRKPIPSILFLDPWGYKGVTLKLINSVVKDWGSECIFFLNYQRVNAAFGTALFSQHVNALFGEKRADFIRSELDRDNHRMAPADREHFIMSQLVEALEENSANYVLKFKFYKPNADRTSHYLVFATKGFRGYEIMKDIMAKESVPQDSVIPTFEYTENPELNMVFTFENPHETLAISVLDKFAGRTLTFNQIYELHSPKTHYIRRNYREALVRLENTGKIIVATDSQIKRRAGTYGETCTITFAK